MSLLQIKTRVWFRPALEKTFKYGYITGLNIEELTVVEETGLLIVTLQWNQQGYTWGKDPNPHLSQNCESNRNH
jgi:hypothetical protein